MNANGSGITSNIPTDFIPRFVVVIDVDEDSFLDIIVVTTSLEPNLDPIIWFSNDGYANFSRRSFNFGDSLNDLGSITGIFPLSATRNDVISSFLLSGQLSQDGPESVALWQIISSTKASFCIEAEKPTLCAAGFYCPSPSAQIPCPEGFFLS